MRHYQVAIPPRQLRLQSALRWTLLYLERIFVGTALVIFSGALLPILPRSGGLEVEAYGGDPLLRSMVVPIYLVTGMVLVLRPRGFLQSAARGGALLLLVGLALLSLLWSAVPEITLRRSAAWAATTLFGLYLASRFGLRDIVRLLAWMLGAVAVASLVLALAKPGWGTHSLPGDPHEGAWRGIFGHKNALGQMMTLSTVTFLILSGGAGRYRAVVWLGAGLSAALVCYSRSVAALAALATLLAVLPLCGVARWRFERIFPVLLGVVLLGGAAATALLVHGETILAAFGKDTTLTGRVALWASLLELVGQQPWIGFGYGGFWLGWEGGSASVLSAHGWEIGHAHNGLIDLWLNLGLLGVVIFLCGFAYAMVQALRWARAGREVERLWPLAFLTVFFLSNLAESSIIFQYSIFWVLYVFVCSRDPAPAREPRSSPLRHAGLRVGALRPGSGVEMASGPVSAPDRLTAGWWLHS